jgi:hypothetical protein
LAEGVEPLRSVHTDHHDLAAALGLDDSHTLSPLVKKSHSPPSVRHAGGLCGLLCMASGWLASSRTAPCTPCFAVPRRCPCVSTPRPWRYETLLYYKLMLYVRIKLIFICNYR